MGVGGVAISTIFVLVLQLGVFPALAADPSGHN